MVIEALLQQGNPPDWASGWGSDRYGVFVEFTVAEVMQRMRFIEPGTFVMGSPEDEPGRDDDEGPQRSVTIPEGFWLFDTPVTQGLYAAVTGENPSRFQSPDRPVEQVSWDDVQVFIEALNERLPGLDLNLPSEAQWEYACRAGTETALYSGPIEILGKNNAPALDSIAWYGGNSGLQFDLENGEDSSDWPEKQYDHERAGTHPVGLKQVNPWGLYDMLGNVWEWTADHWHEDYVGAPEDGSVWRSEDQSARRVVRGGSWFNSARDVRCAMRGRYAPDGRDGSLGFRCARVQP